ncbi:LysM peptidoglycan-binding domain-containing protein [Desulfarculales bacterium]
MTSPSAAGHRNFRLSSLEILITVLVFVGVLYLLTLWSTNLFFPADEAAPPTVPSGVLVERALVASEKVLAEQTSMSRELGSLRKQVESLQAQARKTLGAGLADPVDTVQDRRLDELDKSYSHVPDVQPLLARLDKLEKSLAARPTATPNSAAIALVQQESRLQHLETGLQEVREAKDHPHRTPQNDSQVLERLARLEKALAQRPEHAATATETPLATAIKLAGRAESEARKQSHKVRPGETLEGLARRYKVSVDDIVRWNSLGARRLLLKDEPLTIYSGQNS